MGAIHAYGCTRAACFVLLLACSASVLVSATPLWTPETYPNPMSDVERCGRRGVRSAICDPDGVLTYESANVLEAIIQQIQSQQGPYRGDECGSVGVVGYQVAVAVMQEFKMPMFDTFEATAAAFAQRLHNIWGVGRAECNNGVLLLLSVGNRQVYISTGAGARKRLTDSTVRQIIAAMKPLLRGRRYADAMEGAVSTIGRVLSGRVPGGPGGAGTEDDGEEEVNSGQVWVTFLVIGSLVSGVIAWNMCKRLAESQRYKDCKTKLEKLKRDQAALRASAYHATSCPVCLEDFAEQGDSPLQGSGGSGTLQVHDTDTASVVDRLLPTVLGSSTAGTARAAKALAPSKSSVGAPKAAAAAVTSATARRPLVLQCGHTFCEPCITRWLDAKKHTCPVCRAALDAEDRPPLDPSTRRPGCTDDSETDAATASAADTTPLRRQHHPNALRLNRGANAAAVNPELHLMELLFRLRQLQQVYPEYITTTMHNDWSHSLEGGHELNLTEFGTMSPEARAALESTGKHGAGVNSSFGGGSGGGGGGGSW